jgi:hypothetical protein
MKRLGRKTYNFPSKTDEKIIEKGYVNWWENVEIGNKSTEKTEVKKEIKKSIVDYYYDKSIDLDM